MDPSLPAQRDLKQIELFFGRSSPAQSRIYARLRDKAASRDYRLAGWIRGPRCEYAGTLEATVPLTSHEPGESLLAEAVLPDPCFWTPQMPYLYRFHVELHEGAEVLASLEHTLGIRRMGVNKGRLYFDDRAWVLRAVFFDEVPTTSLASWREAAAAMYVTDPDETLCAQASRLGLLLVAEVSGSADEVTETLRRLGRWPAVGLAVVESTEQLAASIGTTAPNLLLAERCAPTAAIQPAAWAQLVVCEDDDSRRLAERATSSPLPVIAMQHCEKQADVSAARSECDRLQRDLAGRGEFVGYIV